MSDAKTLWALGGESHTAPENTLPAFWAALGSGADGLAIGVRLTSDGVAVCSDRAKLDKTCGDPREVAKVTGEELSELDAGKRFRSTPLDEQNQPAGKGEDTPWSGEGKSRFQWLRHPTLEEVLLLFSRRSRLFLSLHPSRATDKARRALVKAVAGVLERFGLDRSTLLGCDAGTFALARKSLPEAPLVFLPSKGSKALEAIAAAKKLRAKRILLDAESCLTAKAKVTSGLVKALGRNLKVLATSKKMEFALRPAQLQKLNEADWADGILARAIHQTRDATHPTRHYLADGFRGTKTNAALWEIGYSKNNDDTRVFQDDGLVIDIRKGGEYSGGAALSTFSIPGDFDTCIEYEVANPHQGTTFELAAIHVDPGYRTTNLTFDVHGAPPYASSERDENDGFRIGWNNGPALTKFSPTKLTMKQDGDDYEVVKLRDESQSSNLYNEYSRDVGYAKKDSPSGWLRLVRTGSVFNAYYRDKFNSSWVLSGTALVPALAPEVFLRLGAKHWPKKGIVPPQNTVTFKSFALGQRRI